MRFEPTIWRGALALLSGILVAADDARADWTRVTAIPVTDVYSVFTKGDTILAGTDTCVYVSTTGGVTWQASARIAPDVLSVDALRIENGRIFAGTYGWGVFTSANLGASWTAINGGLSGAGALAIVDFESRGSDLYVATDGAGVFVRSLVTPGNWQSFGTALVANQAGGVMDLARAGARLLATGGANGLAFWNDAGMTDWVVSPLNNAGLEPGLQPYGIAWDGGAWIVGTPFGCFRSTTGQGNWAYVGPALGQTLECWFATRGNQVFYVVNDAPVPQLFSTVDHGTTWEPLESPVVPVYEIAIAGPRLYAARLDGLWWRPVGTVSAGDGGGPATLVCVTPQPVRDRVELRFALPAAAEVALDAFDAQGRRVAALARGAHAAGTHTVTWDARELPPGIYLLRLAAAGRSDVLRVARVR